MQRLPSADCDGTFCMVSPASTKMSWADLCEDSDSNDWEEVGHGSGREPGLKGPPSASTASLDDTEEEAPWQRSKQERQHQKPGRRAGRQGPRGSAKGAWQAGQPKAARRARGAGAAPQWNGVIGFSAIPQGCSPMDSFSVTLEGMPLNLCNDACLDAMLHQAGMQGAIENCTIHAGSSEGTAVITLANWPAAVQCYSHFATSRWASGTLKVTMALAAQRSTAWPAEGCDSAGLVPTPTASVGAPMTPPAGTPGAPGTPMTPMTPQASEFRPRSMNDPGLNMNQETGDQYSGRLAGCVLVPFVATHQMPEPQPAPGVARAPEDARACDGGFRQRVSCA